MNHLKTFEYFQPNSKKLCPWCDKHFSPKQEDQKCCCDECQTKWDKFQKNPKAEKPWDYMMKAPKPYSYKQAYR